ncbi:MAG: hypothetical protein HKM24_03145 [Gammaproteobacteria bacterium]|nr:hypothetical protein [Gammaproteobacteria bacterium]
MKWLIGRFQKNRLRLFHLELVWYLSSWNFDGDGKPELDVLLAKLLIKKLAKGLSPADESWRSFISDSLRLKRLNPVGDDLSNYAAAAKYMALYSVVAMSAACRGDWARAYEYYQYVDNHRTLVGQLAGTEAAEMFFDQQAERQRQKAKKERQRYERCMRRFADLSRVDQSMLRR